MDLDRYCGGDCFCNLLLLLLQEVQTQKSKDLKKQQKTNTSQQDIKFSSQQYLSAIGCYPIGGKRPNKLEPMNMTMQSHIIPQTLFSFFFVEKGETPPLFFVVLIGTGLEGVRMDEEGKGRKTVSGRRSG